LVRYVIDGVGKIAVFGLKQAKGFGKRATPHPIFLGVPSPTSSPPDRDYTLASYMYPFEATSSFCRFIVLSAPHL